MFKNTVSTLPWLILTTCLAVYIVLGVLYESPIRPVTICPRCRRPDWSALGGAVAFDMNLLLVAYLFFDHLRL